MKHGGPTEFDNLAYACSFCNRQKGSDVGSLDPATGDFVRFFNPRTDHWREHFELVGTVIVPLTAIGRATTQILNFNHVDRLLERQELWEMGRYPSEDAQRILVVSMDKDQS